MKDKADAVQEYIMHHVANNYDTWHLPFGIQIPLSKIVSLHAIMLLLGVLLCIFLFCVLYKKDEKVPTGMTNLLETLILFVRDDIAIPSLGNEDGRRMMPLLCTLFFFILGLNLIGLVPLFSTATANINVTIGFASITLVVMIVGGIMKNGVVGFAQAFIPHNVPLFVLPMLIPIEFLGMFIKCFALTIRLFANLLAGHIVILSLLGIVVTMGYVAALPAVALSVGIYCLEILVAFIQAYVFTLLSALFIGMIHRPSH